MKKSLLLFFLVNFSLFAQENFLETYHPYRNKAEMAIVVGNYVEASAAYKTAFESVKNPLAKDIFNATVCKFLQNDFEGAKLYLLKLAKKGISVERLEAKDAFGMVNVKNEWQKFKNTYNQIHDMALEKTDNSIWNEIDALVVSRDSISSKKVTFSEEGTGYVGYMGAEVDRRIFNDTLFKKSLPKYTKEEERNYNKIYYEKMVQINDTGIRLLYKILNKEGFFSEEESIGSEIDYFSRKIPQMDGMNQNYSPEDRFMSNKLLITLRKFSYGLRRDGQLVNVPADSFLVLLDFKLKQGIELGKINPEVAIGFSSYEKDYNLNYGTIFKMKIEDVTKCDKEFKNNDFVIYWKPKYMNDLQKQAFENIAKNYGLGTLEETRKKDIYGSIKNNYFIFSSKARFEESTAPNCDAANAMLLEAIKID